MSASLPCISNGQSWVSPRFLRFRISPVYIDFSVSRSLLRHSRGTFPAFASSSVFANGTNRGHHLPRVFRTLRLPASAYIERTALGNFPPKISRLVSLPHDRSFDLSPINITRSGLGPSRCRPQGGPFLTDCVLWLD